MEPKGMAVGSFGMINCFFEDLVSWLYSNLEQEIS